MIRFRAKKLTKAIKMAESHGHPRGGKIVRKDGQWLFTPRGQS